MFYFISYTCTIISLISIIFLFLINYLNLFYINEQELNIPIIESKNLNKFKLPEVEEKNIYNFALLKSKNDKPEIFFDKNEKNLVKKETPPIKKNKKTKVEKKNSISNKKFLVQLGVFKSRTNAENNKRKLEKKMKIEFSKFPLILKPFKKDGNKLFSVSTIFIKKKQAIELCGLLKKNKISCIIKIQEG